MAEHVVREESAIDIDLSIAFVDKEKMLEVNEEFRSVSSPTDVLAFNLSDNTGLSGEIVISPQVAQENSEDAGTSFAEEVELLLVHGILHVLEYDHTTDDGANKMFSRQQQLMAGFRNGGSAKSL